MSSILRFVLLYLTSKFSFKIGKFMSEKIFYSTIKQKYSVQISRNSSEIIGLLTTKLDFSINGGIIPMLNFLVSSIILSFLIVGLMIIRPSVIYLVAFLGGLYLIMALSIRKYLLANSKETADMSTKMIKVVQESCGSIRDIIIDGREEIVLHQFKGIDERLRNSQVMTNIISFIPKYAIEGFGMILLALISVKIFIDTNSSSQTIAFIAILGLSIQRVMPLGQQIYSSWTGVKGAESSLMDLINYIEINKIHSFNGPFKTVKLNQELSIDNLVFKREDKIILDQVSIKICKGDRIAIVGETGCGKSTFIDLIMGLLEPTSGMISVDGTQIDEGSRNSWQKSISHVPQNIFLFDDTIERNITLEDIVDINDSKRLDKIIEIVQLNSYIKSLTGGLKTKVGERGVALSGGQRQRIGIARALYKNSKILVFDEATSALDINTEIKILNGILSEMPDCTLIMITHRKEVIRYCNRTIKINNKKIQDI